MREVVNLIRADTGSVRMKVDELLVSNGITRSKLARLVDADYRVVVRLCSGKAERVDLDLLARVCYALECDLPDIMEYIPPAKQPE
jgi:putative transcriptional regulator